MLDDGKYEYVYGIARTPIAQVSKATGVVEYLHSDPIGSVVAKTSTDGSLLAETSYSPYGKNLLEPVSSFGFAGEWTDADTGYSYLRARWLDTSTGTFLSRDPAVQSTGDAYGYASGNPLSMIDPLGLCSIGSGDLGNLASSCYSFADSSAFQALTDFTAGFGDSMTMGGTKAIRQLAGVDDQVSSCSAFYTAGEWTGTAASFVTPGGVARAGGTTATQSMKAIGSAIHSKMNRASVKQLYDNIRALQKTEYGYVVITAPELVTKRSVLKKNKLITGGPIRYIPPKEWTPNQELPKTIVNGRKGYKDKFDNAWTRGPSRTEDDDFEWDIQLSKKGKIKFGSWSIDGKHVNVSLKGIITH